MGTAMFDDDLFSQLAELPPLEPAELTPRVPSTPETKERYAFLKTKKNGDGWQEGDRIYRLGKTGVTVLKSVK
jgi:hypothetical protein